MKRFSFRTTTVAVAILILGAVPSTQADDCPTPGAQCPRPIQLGVSGINIFEVCSAGTLGALVQLGADKVILSNNHVLARENAGVINMEPIVQPGTLDNSPQCVREERDIVGVLAHFIPIDFSGGPNVLDIAFAATLPSLVDFSGSIARIGLVSTTPFPDVPPVGTLVKKQGRTTGLTFGEISAVNVTASVAYSSGTASFENQYRIMPGSFSAGGDSGSLIVEDTASCPRAVGLLFAGSSEGTLANPLNQFLTFTGSNIVGAPTCPAAPALQRAPDAAMSAAMAVHSSNKASLLATPGVVGVGIGRDGASGAPTLEIYVESDAEAARLALPSSLEGVPVRVIQTGKFVPF